MTPETTTTVTTPPTGSGTGPASAAIPTSKAVDAASVEKLIPPTLFRLTDGLPIHELNQMVTEATECEAALLADIALLEKALVNESMDQAETTLVDQILNTEFAPPDRFFTISSLLGRLREPLAVPLPPTSSRRALQQQHHQQQQQQGKRKTDAQALERYQSLLELEAHPEYHRKHDDPTQLVAAWKRVSSHRTAGVFRRSVNPKEAQDIRTGFYSPLTCNSSEK
ncbi:bromodomain-containing protein [Fragilaria crotonensis]|nr:bromodomain-containing protein [Fragilaria crotonensis]